MENVKPKSKRRTADPNGLRSFGGSDVIRTHDTPGMNPAHKKQQATFTPVKFLGFLYKFRDAELI